MIAYYRRLASRKTLSRSARDLEKSRWTRTGTEQESGSRHWETLGSEVKGCMRKLTQALDSIGTQGRTRTGTPVKAGDFEFIRHSNVTIS